MERAAPQELSQKRSRRQIIIRYTLEVFQELKQPVSLSIFFTILRNLLQQPLTQLIKYPFVPPFRRVTPVKLSVQVSMIHKNSLRGKYFCIKLYEIPLNSDSCSLFQRCCHGIQLLFFIFCKTACIQGITDLRHHSIIKIQIVEYTKTHTQHLFRL